MSRTVNSEWLFDDENKERLRRQMWLVSEFCGIQILTYAILSNHFHMLVRVPEFHVVEDHEVLRRFEMLYAHHSEVSKEVNRHLVSSGSEAGRVWLEKQRRQMGDLSEFMKLFKQRISTSFNNRDARHGPLWSERFTSNLVENGHALQTMASYIDLNPVRAGICTDPKDFRFCGYAEAVAGNQKACSGIEYIEETNEAASALSLYRVRLFGTGANECHKGARIPTSELEKVVKERGKLPRHEVLLCRLRFFTHSAVFGSKEFVETQIQRYQEKNGLTRKREAKSLPPITDWGPITLFRKCRKAT